MDQEYHRNDYITLSKKKIPSWMNFNNCYFF